MQDWRWQSFAELNTSELYEILALRQRVFAVEQNIIYLDPDGMDQKAWHLACWEQSPANTPRRLLAYARAFAPGNKFANEASFGRIVTAPESRGQGLGRTLIAQLIERLTMEYRNPPIRISAQAYLENFYREFGFQTLGEPYIEEGLPHLEMLRPAQ